MKPILFLLLLLMSLVLHPMPLNAQEIKKDIVRINQAYKDYNELWIEVEYNAYEGTSASSLDKQKGLIVRKNNYLYNKIGDVEVVMQDSLRLLVDHVRKSMLLVPSKVGSQDLDMLSPELEKALKSCSQIIPVKSPLGKGYELWQKNGDYKTLSFIYDPNTFLIKKFEFFYKKTVLSGKERENVKLDVEYHYVREGAEKPAIKNQEDFVRKINGAFRCTDRYKSYQLLDYTTVTGQTINR